MRIPNCSCAGCGKNLYRRPHELARVKFTACRECFHSVRANYYSNKFFEKTLSRGRGWNKGMSKANGDNLAYGKPRTTETKKKQSSAMKKWCKDNPIKVAERAVKITGSSHYGWMGGTSKLRKAICDLSQYRTWVKRVKGRDKRCTTCLSTKNLEAHHIKSVKSMIGGRKLSTHHDVKLIPGFFDINNGTTLCRPCHFKKHGRVYNENNHRNI